LRRRKYYQLASPIIKIIKIIKIKVQTTAGVSQIKNQKSKIVNQKSPQNFPPISNAPIKKIAKISKKKTFFRKMAKKSPIWVIDTYYFMS
jgi:hypothetical protein